MKIVGIDISETDVRKSRENIARSGFTDQIEVLRMDATNMDFPDSNFDLVSNFMGLEDIHMTSGMEGVSKTLSEVTRVLKPRGYFSFAAIPPEEMETEAERIEVELFSWLCGCTWLTASEYEQMLKDNGFRLLSKKTYYTGKKLTPDQAIEEIRFACENVPKIYGIKTPSFEDVWARFGSRIEKHGMGHYSKEVLFVSQKRYG